MKTNLLLTILLAFSSLPAAQAQRYILQSNYDLEFSNRLLIRTTPTNLLSRYGAQLPIGLEYGFNRNFGLLIDAGIPLNILTANRHQKNYRYNYLFRTELRAYFGYSRNTKWYMGLEGFTRQQAYAERYGEILKGHYEDYFYTSASVKKQVYGGALKTGFFLHLFGNFCTEFFIGTGMKSVHIDRENIEDLKTPVKATRFMLIVNNEDNVPAQKSLIYFPLGITFTYLLGRNIH